MDDTTIYIRAMIQAALSWGILWAIPLILFALGACFALNLPIFRQERALLFLNLVDLALKRGSLEENLKSMSESRDFSLGARFHLLAAYLQNGYSFSRALGQVPYFLPPQIAAILRVGEEIADLPKVLPAARAALNEGLSKVRAGTNYQILFLLVLNPWILASFPFLILKVFPVFGEIFAGFGAKLPFLLRQAVDYSVQLYLIQLLSFLVLFLVLLFYVGGTRLSSWLERGIYPIHDWMNLKLPWRRKRLLRDFSSMLALLLDARVPEERALRLAAESTANVFYLRHCEMALQQLRDGRGLVQALEAFKMSGDFHWHFKNSTMGSLTFTDSLRAYHETLDAEAFQQEQAAAQFLSTALALINGLVVALVVAAFMQCVFAISALSLGIK